MKNSQFGVNAIISLANINLPVYPHQSNLSNPEAYSESCQTSKWIVLQKKKNLLKTPS